MATKTETKRTKVGKIERQILENIRDRRICPINETHLGSDRELIGVPIRPSRPGISKAYKDLSYHRRVVKNLLSKGFIRQTKVGYCLTPKSPIFDLKVYFCLFKDSSGDDQWLATKQGSRRDARVWANDIAYGRGWRLSEIQLLTTATIKQLLQETKNSNPAAMQKLTALLDMLPQSTYTSYGITFCRKEEADGTLVWSTTFGGNRYIVWQPVGCIHWIVSQLLGDSGSTPLNLGLIKSGQVQEQSGPLFIHCHIEPSHLFWMTFLSEYLAAPQIYSLRKSLIDLLHSGDPVSIDDLLSLNPDKLISAKNCTPEKV